MVRIPEEYQEVEYLESTGTQWIDTGTTINNGCVISIDFYIADTAVNRILWGYRRDKTYQYPYQAFIGANNKKLKYIAFGIRSDNIPDVFDYDIRNSVVIDSVNKTIKVNDEIKDCYENFDNGKAFNLDGSSEYHPYLFALNANGSELAISSDTKIYGYSVSYDGSFLQNFIPCYRKSDNEIGMYDTVTGTFFTNQGTGTFLKGNDVNYDTVNLMESRRRILLNTPHLESLTGSALSFKTDMTNKLKECRIHFTPIQEGTGDPSPDNVRPIVGWDGVTVTRCGKNLIPSLSDTDFWERNAYINRRGRVINSSRYKMCDYKPAFPNKDYRFTTPSISWVGIGFYDSSYVPLNFIEHNGGKVSLISPNNAKYYRLYAQNNSYDLYLETSDSVDNHVDYPTSSFTDYEPYTAQSLTIPFPQTIYGGYVDLVKGEVVEEWSKVTFTELVHSTGSKDNSTVTTKRAGRMSPYMLHPEIHTFYIPAISNQLTLKQSSFWNETNWEAFGVTYSGYKNGDDVYFAFYNSTIAVDAENDTPQQRTDKMNTYLEENPLEFCYELATPNSYPLDPVTIRTLKGINNIWSNANGNIEVNFWTH